MTLMRKILNAFKIERTKEDTNDYFSTEKGKEVLDRYKERKEKRNLEELELKTLHDSFTIEDMYQFSDIPFEWNLVMDLRHTNGVAWFMLNTNNQFIALQYINYINEIIIDSHSYISGIDKFEMCTEEIDFFYPVPAHVGSMTNTYVECIPYTKTGKVSKYPVVLHFASSELIKSVNGYEYQCHPYMGVIKIMQDGNIGMASVTFIEKHTKFSIGLYGINLVIKRVDSDEGNLFKYSNLAD